MDLLLASVSYLGLFTGAISCGAASSPESVDPYFYHVSFLADATGQSNGTGYAADESRYAHALTYNGGCQIASGAFFFDGIDDYISVPDSILFTPGSRVTLEDHGVIFNSASGDQVLISQNAGDASAQSWKLMYSPGAQGLWFGYSTSGSTTNVGPSLPSWTPTVVQSYDIAVSWDGATIRLYVDGLFEASAAYSGAFFNCTQPLRLGCDFNAGSGRNFFNGSMKAVRMTRGVARMTNAAGCYTRPLLPFCTTQDTLTDSQWGNVLLLVSGGADGTTIRDESPYDWPLSNNAVTVSTGVQLVSGVNSLVLNGSSHIAIGDDPLLELLGLDFTMEAFVQHSVNTTDQAYLSKWGTPSGRSWLWTYRGASTPDAMMFQKTSSGGSAGTADDSTWTPTVGTPYHVAHCRNGSNYRSYAGGSQIGATDTTAVTLSNVSDPIRIGAVDSSGLTLFMNGYMSEIRITKGNARYTGGSITVPTAAFPRG